MKFEKRGQGNYFCKKDFDRVLEKYASHQFLSVYITSNEHYCDECGDSPAKYRVRF